MKLKHLFVALIFLSTLAVAGSKFGAQSGGGTSLTGLLVDDNIPRGNGTDTLQSGSLYDLDAGHVGNSANPIYGYTIGTGENVFSMIGDSGAGASRTGTLMLATGDTGQDASAVVGRILGWREAQSGETEHTAWKIEGKTDASGVKFGINFHTAQDNTTLTERLKIWGNASGQNEILFAGAGIASIRAGTGGSVRFGTGTTHTFYILEDRISMDLGIIPGHLTSAALEALAVSYEGILGYDTTLDKLRVSDGAEMRGITLEDPFQCTATITSAAAGTPVSCLAATKVPADKQVFIDSWRAKVNGATLWATTASCTIEDTNGVDFVSIPTTAMTGNAFINDNSVGLTLANPYAINTGGTADHGVQIDCDANGTGSDLVVTVSGFIK